LKKSATAGRSSGRSKNTVGIDESDISRLCPLEVYIIFNANGDTVRPRFFIYRVPNNESIIYVGRRRDTRARLVSWLHDKHVSRDYRFVGYDNSDVRHCIGAFGRSGRARATRVNYGNKAELAARVRVPCERRLTALAQLHATYVQFTSC